MEREIIVKSISMNIQNLNEKMNNAIMHLEKEFQSLRTSRANPLMLENISVEAYGAKTPINQLGNISAPDPSTLTIQVWDNNLIKNVENAILESNLGLNPQSDGPIIRLPIPKLSEERRQELTKIASQYAENSKVVIRNLRRDFIDIKKNDKKKSEISEDELKKFIIDAQKSTDNSVDSIEKLLESKRNEILKV